MVTRDEKEKQWFWMMPELRQEMKMVATRRRMTLDAAYNEAVQEWIHPAMQDEALGDLLRGERKLLLGLARMIRLLRSVVDVDYSDAG